MGDLACVSDLAAGGALVDAEDLRAKLGRAGYLTWQILATHRDYEGETHITLDGVLRAKRKRFAGALTRRTLLRALARLEEAGLVENLGWLEREVPVRGHVSIEPVYVRLVKGAELRRTLANASARARVPVSTKAWLTRAKAWGGARAGAGRRPQEGQIVRQKNSSGRRLDSPEIAASENSSGHPRGTSAGIQVVTPSKSKSKERENTGCGFSLPSVERNRAACSAAGSDLIEGDGMLSGGGTSPTPLLGFPFRGVPRFPGNAVVEPATVPDAPLLPLDATDEVLATQVARAYRGVIEKRYGGRCFMLAKGDIKRSKHYKALVAFAHQLQEHEIPPAAWCAHRVDRWRGTEIAKKTGRQPTLVYVFAMKAISDEHRWQYRVEYGDSRLGGRQLFSKPHLELLARYKGMHGDIVRGMPKDEAVAKHFPDDLYNELVERAKLESHETRFRLEDKIRRGVFVW